MSWTEDDRLREDFADLRRRDRESAPPFTRIAAAAEARSPQRMRLKIGAAAMAALALAITFAERTQQAPRLPAQNLSQWSSPTAFLLETPGWQFLNQTPRLGGPPFELSPAAQEGLNP
jgi:hypothetical protein